MSRFAGVRNGSIYTVSTASFEHSIAIPESLSSVSSEKLITEYIVKDSAFLSKGRKKHAKDLKVAFVSNYRMKCGISTYAESLFPEIAKHVSDTKLFAEH